MAQIVPTEVLDASSVEGRFARLGRGALNGFPVVVENELSIPPFPPSEDSQRIPVERYSDCFSGLELVGMNPCDCPCQVDLVPPEEADIALAQPGGERELGHVGQMRR